MKTLKLVRGIAFSTAILSALGTVGIMIYGLEMGLNDYNLLGSLAIFCLSALYAIAVDAEISKRNTDVEEMKKLHGTTITQCVCMMIFLLCMSTLCLFL
jgi:hypothetical protein